MADCTEARERPVASAISDRLTLTLARGSPPMRCHKNKNTRNADGLRSWPTKSGSKLSISHGASLEPVLCERRLRSASIIVSIPAIVRAGASALVPSAEAAYTRSVRNTLPTESP